jgi:hypothetical protein
MTRTFVGLLLMLAVAACVQPAGSGGPSGGGTSGAPTVSGSPPGSGVPTLPQPASDGAGRASPSLEVPPPP